MQILRIVFWLPFTGSPRVSFSDSMTPLFGATFRVLFASVPDSFLLDACRTAAAAARRL